MKHELQCDAFAAMETATASFDAGEELEDLGLSRQFYDTQFDFPKFQADEYADKFLLGVSVRVRRPLYSSCFGLLGSGAGAARAVRVDGARWLAFAALLV